MTCLRCPQKLKAFVALLRPCVGILYHPHDTSNVTSNQKGPPFGGARRAGGGCRDSARAGQGDWLQSARAVSPRGSTRGGGRHAACLPRLSQQRDAVAALQPHRAELVADGARREQGAQAL